MTAYNQEFIRQIPKTDLHLHLDGSLRLSTLIELAKESRVDLPSYTVDGLKETLFKERYASLVEYLHPFGYTCAVLQDGESLERVSFELAEDCFNEGVRYIEVRFAPQLHVHEGFSLADVLRSVTWGLQRAKQEINRAPAIIAGQEPRFEFGIIACALRMFTPEFSEYFRRFFELHRFSPAESVHAMASLEMARAVVALRNEEDLPIVGFDLAGQEEGYPAEDHSAAYACVHKHFMNKTVHAGEAYGPESIFQAITDLHADRIGHGCQLFRADRIHSPNIKDREEYVDRLVQYIAERRITIEVCLTSNLQTMPEITNVAEHPLGKMLARRLSVSLCTDNRTVSHTSMCNEIAMATQSFDLPPQQLRNLIIYGFKRSFFPRPYAEKRDYVHQVVDFYQKIAESYGYV